MADAVSAQPQNVARGCQYTMTPRPNYPLTTDTGDDRQLTDGAYTAWNPIWLRPSTVGWTNATPVTIVIDLRSVQAISGVSYNTAAGQAGVEWPRSVFVLVSDDGQRFFPVADLAGTQRAAGAAPPAIGYAAFRYQSDPLDTHGRYVALVVDQNGPYTFSDEIEVFAGDPGRVGSPLAGASTTDLQDYFVRAHMRVSIQQRLTIDLRAARAALAAAPVGVLLAEQLSHELDAIAEGIVTLTVLPDPAGFAAVVPLNDLHARIFAVQAAIARANGFPELSAWPANPWDFLRPLDKPPAAATRDTVSIVAMNGETRAGAINVSSAASRPMTVSLNVAGAAADMAQADLRLSEVVWTDTRELIPVADALLPLADPSPALMLPAGLTRQIWLSFTPRRRTPGMYRGYVELTADTGAAVRIPLELTVLAGDFPERRALHLGGWDYTNITNVRGLTPVNTPVLVERLRALGVDSPWATNTVMPPGRFDTAGLLSEPPSTTEFDSWIASWPDASSYFIFVNAQSTFGNVSSVDATQFAAALGAWATFWVQHAHTIGVAPSQLVLLLVDEPHSPAQDDRIVTWARAIKAAEPAVRIWEDPTYRDPAASPPPLLDVVDVIALKSWLMVEQGPAFVDFYRRRGERGQELAVYGASGPARLLDPFTYQRLQAWACADLGAKSSFFWSFSDDADGHSWNEYATTKTPYSPFFLSATEVTISKHTEAIREGAEDFEYLTMLRRRVAALQESDANYPGLAEAAAFLGASIATVMQSSGATDVQWTSDKDRSSAERMRLAIAAAIEWLAAPAGESSTGARTSIGRARPSVTVTGGTFVYDGQPHPALAAATGAYGVHVPGSFALTYTPGGSAPPVYGGVYPFTARFTSSDPDYADAHVDGTIVVVETTSVSVAAASGNSAFGQAVTFGATVVAASGSAPAGAVRFRLDGQPVGAAVTLNAGSASVTMASMTPGRHIISAEYGGGNGLTASTGSIEYTVARATPIVNWTVAAIIPYGTAFNATALDATANVPGTFVYAPPAGTVLSAGPQQLTVTFVPADGTDYETATKTVALMVTPATPAITVASATITYDGSPHPLAPAATGIDATPVGGSFAITYTPGGSSPPVDPGTYSATVTFRSSNGNYSDANATASIAITPAPLTARMTYPPDRATDVDLSIPIQWTAVLNVQAYYLYVGSARGAKDIVDSGEIVQTSYRVRNLPFGTVYARLWARVAGVWRYTDSSFSARPLVATLIYPLNGATDVDLSTSLYWTAFPNVQAYYLYVGSTPGARDLVDTGEMATTSYRVSSLPHGQPVYARLWTKVGGAWRYADTTFSVRSY
jgi:hypothetical protein